MYWRGSFVFGDTYAAYFGPSDDNDLHSHAAYQIVLSPSGRAKVTDKHGVEHIGAAFLIRPMVAHALRSPDSLTLIYLDPQSVLVTAMMNHVGCEDIPPLPSCALPFSAATDREHVLQILKDRSKVPSEHLDNRLMSALRELAAEPGHVTIAECALLCGLSESRLRSIARNQFGVPLSTWLIWRKLERAARELSDGANLADAALAGGFSDQAHFSRAMRRMFGVTPNVAAKSLRP